MKGWYKYISIRSLLSICYLFLFLFIQSCAKTKIGEQLSASFDEPKSFSSKQTLNPIDNNENVKNVKEYSNSKNKSIKEEKQSSALGEPKQVDSRKNNFKKSPGNIKKSSSQLDISKKIFKPQPYRITIKLSKANPSAPAEVVTKALRAAGVSFEVEMIERIDLKDKRFRMRSGEEL